MRRKTYLEQRMQACREYLPVLGWAYSDSRLADTQADYSVFLSLFDNNHPIDLEIGCGMGSYTVERASMMPDRNLIAVERISNVLVVAAEKAMARGVQNLRFFNTGAEYLPKYIPDHVISDVILNFPTPLPNSPAEKQRLTSPRYLALYKRLLTEEGELEFKTDKDWFYDYTLETLVKCGYDVLFCTRDLHSSGIFNIATEHERKYSRYGDPIYYIRAKVKP